jgi:molecular chaperone GrpE
MTNYAGGGKWLMGNNNEAAEADNRQTGHIETDGIDEACNEEIDRSESQLPEDENGDICDNENPDDLKSKLAELEKSLEEKTRQAEEYYDMLLRKAAEFDNYRKRIAREKSAICDDITCEVVSRFIPVVDNLERAVDAAKNEADSPLKEGIEMIYRQMKEVLSSLGVEEIEAVGSRFNPEIHNAVAHIDDKEYGENEIVEEFQKGYILKDKEKVIRHSAVKVAN